VGEKENRKVEKEKERGGGKEEEAEEVGEVKEANEVKASDEGTKAAVTKGEAPKAAET